MPNGTEENLKEAFAGESQANRKYLTFARKAEEEGYHQIAKLFRAAAEAETVHAQNHLRVLGAIGSTQENLRQAIEGESHESESMYPTMLERARQENRNDAYQTFHFANSVEKIHLALYRKALDNFDSNEEVDYFVCPVCGNTVEKAPPDKCPICGASAETFVKIF